MNFKTVLSGLAALALSAMTAAACNLSIVSGVVSCPNGTPAEGIILFIVGGGDALSTTTASDGSYIITGLEAGKYTICVDTGNLPPGLSIQGNPCAKFAVDGYSAALVNFTVDGPACEQVPPEGCWLTGGGTIGKGKIPDFNYGGVVNPGCSSIAAGGGNWNVIDCSQNLHFKGLFIAVIQCSGVSDKAPAVDVNIIDFEGAGILEGIEGNALAPTVVLFKARAIDSGEPGAGKDALYLNAYFSNPKTTSQLLISTDLADPTDVAPVLISTGNLQIHTTGCNK